jgi:Tfp pilus assembly protein PilE
LVVIAIIGVLVALLLPAIQAAREAARRTQCQTNLHNLALGMHNYHDTRKALPYAVYNPRRTPPNAANPYLYNGGADMTGPTALFQANWTIQILPYIEEQPLYDSFVLYDEEVPGSPGVTGASLTSGVNRVQRGTTIQYMLCPSDIGLNSFCSLSGGNWARGNYGLNAGLAMMWVQLSGFLNPSDPENPWPKQCGRGVASVNRGAKVTQIEDGTSKTIMLAELRVGLSDKDRRGTWAMALVGSNLLGQQASNGTGPPNDCASGNDDLTDYQAVIDELGREYLESECMYPYDGNWNNSVQTTVRSRHPGGAFAALCDGSVRFISDNVQSIPIPIGYEVVGADGNLACPAQAAYGIWQRLNSSNDGYVTDDSSF